MKTSYLPFFIIGLMLTSVIWAYFRHRARLRFINEYPWPPGLVDKLKRHHPQLGTSDILRVEQGLRQFFRAYLNGGRRPVSMPSQVVDDLWHEFILYTREYDRFCKRAFGRFLHHTPTTVLKKGAKASNEGLRRVWWQACKEERIDPKVVTKLPLIFTLDATLGIAGGRVYAPDCEQLRRQGVQGTQCGSDFSSTGYDGGTAGMGDGGGDGGDGGGDGGGGCGGD